VDRAEFVKYFDLKLPQDPDQFLGIIQQFMQCARACRARKDNLRSGSTSKGSWSHGPAQVYPSLSANV
jgi:hypothetical protein